MPEKLSWTCSVRVDNGPQITATASLQVDGYDKQKILMPKAGAAGAKPVKVSLAPPGAGQLQVIVINPVKPDAKLQYKAGNRTVVLDGPHLLIGAGAADLLAALSTDLVFENATGADAEVDILFGYRLKA